MVRKIDDLGRIVIPKEDRKTLNIQKGDELEITIEDNGIFVRKKGCIFCGRNHSAIYHEGVQLCEHCLDAINANASNCTEKESAAQGAANS